MHVINERWIRPSAVKHTVYAQFNLYYMFANRGHGGGNATVQGFQIATTVDSSGANVCKLIAIGSAEMQDLLQALLWFPY